MPIIDVQRDYMELGRIRLGMTKVSQSGKSYPAKLDTFRFTSPSRSYIEKVAEKFGGDVAEWESPAGPQFEVVTKTSELSVLVPPQDIERSQWYELWSGGGNERRCDGATQQNGQPCLCNPTDRDCNPVTHLALMLPELPGLGQWHVVSHGYSAASELPLTVDLLSILSAQKRAIAATLRIDHRTSKKSGETRKFVVPALSIDHSLVELEEMLGVDVGAGIAALASGAERSTQLERPALPEERPALPAQPAEISAPEEEGLQPSDSSGPGTQEDGPTAPPLDADHDSKVDEIREEVMALRPSGAMKLARELLENRPPTTGDGSAMKHHQLWVRRLFYALERCNVWKQTPKGLDPLHAALRTKFDADHLSNLRREQLLEFCQQAFDAAEPALSQFETSAEAPF